MRIVLVTGGRNNNNKNVIYGNLDLLHGGEAIDVLIHGGYKGADTIADEWAIDHGVQRAIFPACWDYYPAHVAGPRRNAFMLAMRPNIVVAFNGGPGTANTVNLAKRLNIQVWDLRQI